jgi:hypothetical protein
MRGREKDLKKLLWENVRALMLDKYGRENLTLLAKEAGIGVASIQRIKEMQTSVGIDILEKVAKAFRMEPHQIICPVVDAKHFQTVCIAYNLASNESKALLLGLAEQIIRVHNRAEQAGKGD